MFTRYMFFCADYSTKAEPGGTVAARDRQVVHGNRWSTVFIFGSPSMFGE